MPVVDRGETRALDPRSIEVERISGWILTAVTAALAAVGLALLHRILSTLYDIPWWVGLLLPFVWLTGVSLLGVHSHRWPVRAYRHSSYRVDPRGIEIRRGVYWRVVINVPRSRVQHTDVSQGPLERRYGLGTLVIYTAGTDHAQVQLPGLEHGVALALREQLLPAGDADAV